MPADQSVDEMFGLLSDETRVAILRAVALAEYELAEAGAGPATLTFSDVYERVEVDNTSKLAYHLGELTGVYLRKDGDEYALTHAGERIVRFILSGNYEEPADVGPEAVSGVCLFCGAEALEASLPHQFFRIDCTACGRQVAGQPVTPAQTRSRDAAALIRSVKHKSVRDYREIRRDICPECSGRLSTDIFDVRESPLPDAENFLVHNECQQCLREYNSPLTHSVVYHPASVAFHWDRGVDVTTRGVWEFGEHLRAGRWRSEQRASDGEADDYEVHFLHDADELHFELDESATVTHVERVRRERHDESGN